MSLAAPDSAPTSVLTQNDVIANNDQIEISISGYPQSGNWLGSNGLDEPYLFFRLYDAETILTRGNDTFELPAVKLETCS